MFDRFAQMEASRERRTLLLCRRSSSDGTQSIVGADHGRGFGEQEAELWRWVENHVAGRGNMTIISVDGSGQAGLRSTIERLATGRNRRFGTIVVTSLDRICRGPEVHELLRLVEASGIRLIVMAETGEQRQ